jgi:hypothetical protein
MNEVPPVWERLYRRDRDELCNPVPRPLELVPTTDEGPRTINEVTPSL